MDSVLPFPPHRAKRGRKRKREGMEAAGFLTLMLMDRDGEDIPANVQRMDEPQGETMPERTPELLLALMLWGELSARKRESICQQARCMAYATKPDPAAVQLHNLLRKHRRR